LGNKGELHLVSQQRFNYCCAENLHTSGPYSDPLQFLQNMNGKTGIFLLKK